MTRKEANRYYEDMHMVHEVWKDCLLEIRGITEQLVAIMEGWAD